MKIDDLNQGAVLVQIVAGKNDKAEPSEANADGAAKQENAAVKVELSPYMPVVPSSQKEPEPKAERLAELKAQIQSGTYEVSSRDIAEKMLTSIAKGTVH